MMPTTHKTSVFHSRTARIVLLFCFAFGLTWGGCVKAKGKTSYEKRAYVQNMRSETLRKLYTLKPEVEHEIATAAGYGVFDAFQSQIIITSFGNGYGVIHNNRTHKDTYMSTFGLGAGYGLGAQKHQIIVVFENEEIINKMIDKGWTLGASGTAAAKLEDDQSAATGSVPFVDGMKIYSFTDKGVMLGVSLRGSKIWKDKDLN